MSDTSANSKLFKSAILQQALQGKGEKSIHGNLGVVEVVHWARLGVQVGYLEMNDALRLMSYDSHRVLEAWSALKTNGYLPSGHDWADIFQEQDDGHHIFNEDWFAAGEITDAKSEFLQGMYQTLLLLLAENILDESSRYFLDMVVGASDSDWQSLMSGNRLTEHGDVQIIGTGLANVLNYWAEVESLLNYPILQTNRQPSLPPLAEILRAAEWKEKIIDPIFPEIIAFGRNLQRILSSRFNLGTIEFVERYFALAGEFANRVGDNSPAWLDARLDAFQSLILQIVLVGGAPYVYSESNRERLWFAFRRGVEGLRINTTDVLSEKTRVSPPKKFVVTK